MGFTFDKNERQLDPEYIAAIKNVPAPINISQLTSFLGLVRHCSSFLPKLHLIRNNLLKKDVPRNWSPGLPSKI